MSKTIVFTAGFVCAVLSMLVIDHFYLNPKRSALFQDRLHSEVRRVEQAIEKRGRNKGYAEAKAEMWIEIEYNKAIERR